MRLVAFYHTNERPRPHNLDRADLAKSDALETAEGRLANREFLDTVLAVWCRQRSPYEVMALCQQQGVPAGNMLRLQELLQNPHYKARQFFRELDQPTVGRPVETEGGPVSLNPNYAPPVIRPAPLPGEHTRQLSKDMLGLSDDQIDTLISTGDLEVAG